MLKKILNYFRQPTGSDIVDGAVEQFTSIVDRIQVGISLIDRDIEGNQRIITTLKEENKALGEKKVEGLKFRRGIENLLAGG